MITVPTNQQMLLRTLRYSHVKTVWLNIYHGKTLVTRDVRISAGTIKADRSQRARRTLDCDIPRAQWQDVPGLSVMRSRVQVLLGFDIGTTPIVVPGGVFRVDRLGRSNGGVIKVTGTSLEAYVIDDIYVKDQTVPKGTNVLAQIQKIIKQSVPDAVFDISAHAQSQAGVVTPLILSGKQDRWEIVESLSFLIGCDVYCAPNGKFRIAKRPSMSDGKPVVRLNEGPDGVLVSINTEVSRDETYNGVLAMGKSVYADIPPVSALTVDSDPNSPTYWGNPSNLDVAPGPFGRKTKIYESELLTNKTLCQNKGKELLDYYLAEDRKVDFSAVPNPLLEPDDMVQVAMMDGTVENHLLTSMSIPLGLGAWDATTLSNKSREQLDPASPLEFGAKL